MTGPESTHDERLTAAKGAVEALMADTAVSSETTLESLYEVRAKLDRFINAVEDGIAMRKRGGG